MTPFGLAWLPLLGHVGVIGLDIGRYLHLGAHLVNSGKPYGHRIADLGVETQAQLGLLCDLFEFMMGLGPYGVIDELGLCTVSS